MALLWFVPAWFIIDERKTAATFAAVGVWFGMLPDVDLVLSSLFPGIVKHHGVFHTVLMAAILAVIVGPLVGGLLKRTVGGSAWFTDRAVDNATSFGVVMVFVAGVAHVFADMLSAPDIADSVEPLWPLYQQSFGIDIVWYNNPTFNWGLFAAGILVNVALYFWAR